MENYNCQYFINKFEAIPEGKWCVASFNNDEGASCAQGHLGVSSYNCDDTWIGKRVNREYRALVRLFNKLKNNIPKGGCKYSPSNIAYINNGWADEYRQSTPKQRILAALNDIRDKQLEEANIKEAKDIISEDVIEKVLN